MKGLNRARVMVKDTGGGGGGGPSLRVPDCNWELLTAACDPGQLVEMSTESGLCARAAVRLIDTVDVR